MQRIPQQTTTQPPVCIPEPTSTNNKPRLGKCSISPDRNHQKKIEPNNRMKPKPAPV
jgi:hypothetical protein